MLKKEPLYSLQDIVILPAVLTNIKSRKECLPFRKGINLERSSIPIYYPLITAPMDFVKLDNLQEFEEAGISTIIPRLEINPFEERVKLMENYFCAFGLDECQKLLEMDITSYTQRILIDIANGTMEDEIEMGKKLRKRFGEGLYLMGGNIGHPLTYLLYDEAGFDYVRVGIGDGAGCLTSKQLGVSYPYASLISDISEYKNRYHSHCKIIADGGMNEYSDIIKCLALGADYVMCGKLFAQAALKNEEIGTEFIYRGMSTKSAQKDMGRKVLKTAEGRTLKLKKEYTLAGWIENFDSYIRSAMSYCDSRDLKEFREKAICQVVSSNASYKINDK